MATNPLHRPITMDELPNLRAHYKMQMDSHAQGMSANWQEIKAMPPVYEAGHKLQSAYNQAQQRVQPVWQQASNWVQRVQHQAAPALHNAWERVQRTFRKTP